jgi:hypothetical protein
MANDPYAQYGGKMDGAATATAPAEAAPAAAAPTGDPYAKYGGTVDGATAAPAAAAAAQQTTAPAESGGGGMGEYFGPTGVAHVMTGAERGVAKTIIGGKDAFNKHVADTGPESHYMQGMREFSQQPSANVLESAGEFGETMIEMLTPENLLKFVSPLMKGTEALEAAAKIGKMIKEHPLLAKTLSLGKNAALGGGQGYVKSGGDSTEAGMAAAAQVMGGGLVIEGLPSASKAVGELVENIRPRTGHIDTVPVTRLASQMPEGSQIGGATTANTPKVAKAQQVAAGRVIRNTAQRATRDSIERLNATRPEAPRVTDESRMLTSGEGALPQGAEGPQPQTQPFTFHIEGPPTYEDVRPPTGSPREDSAVGEPHQRNVVVPGRQRQIGTGVAPRVESFPTEADGSSGQPHSTRTTPEWWAPGSGAEGPLGKPQSNPKAPSGVRKVPIYQYLTDIRPGSEPIPLDKGGGRLTTSDPQVAQTTLSRLNELVDSGHVPEADLPAVKAARDSLQEQMDLYHAYDNEGRNISGAHFPKVHPEQAARNVETFRDSADQARMPATPVYQKLDELSKGDFTKWNDQRKRANAILQDPERAPITEQAHRDAVASLKQANDEIYTIFATHRDKIKPSDWTAASNAWRDGAILDDIHTTVERAFNRNDASKDQAARIGRARTLRGDNLTENLNKLTDTPEKKANVLRVIGEDGLNNLYDLGEMLRTPESAEGVNNVAKNVGMYLAHRGGIGATAGAGIGLATAGPGGAFAGGLAGAAADAGTRYVLRKIATEPKIAKMVKFAAEAGARPQNYGPLIAAMIAGTEQGMADTKPAAEKPK